MPDYSYRCQTCDKTFELNRPLGHLDIEACPSCGGESNRVFTVFENPPKIGGGACSSHAEKLDSLDPQIFEN